MVIQQSDGNPIAAFTGTVWVKDSTLKLIKM